MLKTERFQIAHPGSPFLVACLVTVAALAPAPRASAQEGEKERPDPAKIEPYTGPQIYLPEGEAPPEPKKVDSQLVVEKFPGTETVRFERRVTRYSDDSYKSDGEHKEYYASGQLYVEGEFTRGRASGKWTYHHPNGEVAKVVNYVDGQPDGEVRVLNEEGKLVALRRYEKGQREGVWEIYSQDGADKLREDIYQDGRANGVFRIWFPGGQIQREISFVDGKQDGVSTEWTATGEKRAEVNFKEGLRDGKATIWSRDGKTTVRNYSKGKIVPNS